MDHHPLLKKRKKKEKPFSNTFNFPTILQLKAILWLCVYSIRAVVQSVGWKLTLLTTCPTLYGTHVDSKRFKSTSSLQYKYGFHIQITNRKRASPDDRKWASPYDRKSFQYYTCLSHEKHNVGDTGAACCLMPSYLSGCGRCVNIDRLYII